MNNKPLISVVMSVYNTEADWLRESIESVLKQTYSNFEFIICLDCPTDNSESIVYDYSKRDNRIIIIKNSNNLGLTRNLHNVMNMAQGKYVARMDSDDISMPTRFEKQVEFLETHDSVSVIVSRAQILSNNKKGRVFGSQLTEDDELNRINMMFFNAGIVHPTAMIRSSFLKLKHINYDTKMLKSQDYGLWVDILANGGIIRELQEPLLLYRVHPNQITNRQSNEQIKCLKYSMRKQLLKMNIDNEKMLDIHFCLYAFDGEYSVSEYDEYIGIILEANKKYNTFEQEKFRNVILKIWKHDILKAVFKKKKLSFLKSKYLIEALCTR